MASFSLTLAVSLLFGFLLRRLRIPGGMMIGAIIAAAALNIGTELAYMPYEAKFCAQAIAGAFIGVSIHPGDLKRLPRLFRPLCLLLLCYFIVSLTAGLIIWQTSPLDFVTSMMSCVPGGMSDIPIISDDMGADAPKVAALHFIRMAVGISVFPALIRALDQRTARQGSMPPACRNPEDPLLPQSDQNPQPWWAFPLCLAVSLICGWLMRLTDIPAAALVGSLLGAMLLKLRFGLGFLPPFAKKLAQAFSGAYIGCSVGYADLVELRFLMLPALIILAAFTLNCFFAGELLRRRFGFERKMAMLSATPAGATDMALISSDIGVEDSDLIILQILRMICVILLFPQVIAILESLIGQL